MSSFWRFEFEITPVATEGEAEHILEILDAEGYGTEDDDGDGGYTIADATMRVHPIEGMLYGGHPTKKRHEHLASLFPDKEFTSRWKCLEQEEWDHEFSKK